MATTVESIVIEEDSSDLQKAAKNVRALESELADLEKAMKTMSQASSVDISAFKKLQAEAQATKDKLAGAQQEFLKFGGSAALQKADAAAKSQANALKLAQDEAKKLAALQDKNREDASRKFLADQEKQTKAREDAAKKFAAFKFNENVRKGEDRQADAKKAAEEQTAKMDSMRAAIVAAVALVAAAVAALAAKLVVAGAKLAISAGMFREKTEQSFAFLLGSTTAAKQLYEQALDVADEVGLDAGLVVEKLKVLLLAGFGKDEAIAAIKAAGDLAAVTSEAAGEALLDIFKKAKAGGTFGERELKSLKALGIQTADVYAALAKATGKSVAEVQALVKAGAISAEEGIKAVEAAIEKRVGGAGAKTGASLQRLWGDLIGNFTRLFDKVDLGPLKKILEGAIGILKGPAGEKLRAGINALFGAAFDILGKLFSGKEGEERITKIVEGLATAIQIAADVLRVAGPVIVAVVGTVLDIMLAISGAAQSGSSSVVAFFDAIFGFFSSIGSFIMSIPSMLFGEAMNAGTSLTSGFAQGITAGGSSIVAAMVSAVQGAIAAARSALGMRSPSKVGMAIGANFGGSQATGIRSAIPDIKSAAKDLANASAAANDNSGGAPAPASSGGGPVSIQVHHASPAVNVPPGTTPEEARKLASAVHAGDQEKFNGMLLVALQHIRRAS